MRSPERSPRTATCASSARAACSPASRALFTRARGDARESAAAAGSPGLGSRWRLPTLPTADRSPRRSTGVLACGNGRHDARRRCQLADRPVVLDRFERDAVGEPVHGRRQRSSCTPNDRWTHTFVLGVDGYRLANPALDDGPIPSATDSALAAARGGGDRVTARVTSAAHFGSVGRAATVLTFTAEHCGRSRGERGPSPWSARAATTVTRPGEADERASEARLIGWRGNTGLVAQANTSLPQPTVPDRRPAPRARRRAGRVDARDSSLPMLGGALVDGSWRRDAQAACGVRQGRFAPCRARFASSRGAGDARRSSRTISRRSSRQASRRARICSSDATLAST